jgi:hypothetical protein
MAHRPLQPKTEYIRMPIPDVSEIDPPPMLVADLPVDGMPQDMTTYEWSPKSGNL